MQQRPKSLTRTKPAKIQRRARAARRPASRREGFALLLSMIALTILAVLVADLHETTGTSFAASIAERDQLKAELLARSGVNLTRMLVAQERPVRTMLNMFPITKMMFGGRPIPQIPVWHYANMLLKPFADFNSSKGDAESAGFDLDLAEGLGDTGGSFEILGAAENGKVNVNHPRLRNDEMSRLSVAGPLYQLMAPARFDPLFSQFDEKGRMSNRGDLIANIIDWWDIEDQRTSYDPTMGTIQSSGGEDTDYYRDQPEPYLIKNAPFDTLEELRLVRGMTDDAWATFVEPDVEDPSRRTMTVWAGTTAAINPNEAEPEVLLARVCGFTEFKQQPLCNDPTGMEPSKFLMVLRMVRSLPVPLPVFSRRADFVDFITGKPTGLMELLMKMLTGGLGGAAGGLLGGGGSSSGSSGTKDPNQSATPFTGLKMPTAAVNGVSPADFRKELERNFTTTSKFITIEAIGRVGHVQKRLRTVVNFDTQWLAPPPNTAQAQPLGVFAYFRVE
jgi:general secretion pathway protein K